MRLSDHLRIIQKSIELYLIERRLRRCHEVLGQRTYKILKRKAVDSSHWGVEYQEVVDLEEQASHKRELLNRTATMGCDHTGGKPTPGAPKTSAERS